MHSVRIAQKRTVLSTTSCARAGLTLSQGGGVRGGCAIDRPGDGKDEEGCRKLHGARAWSSTALRRGETVFGLRRRSLGQMMCNTDRGALWLPDGIALCYQREMPRFSEGSEVPQGHPGTPCPGRPVRTVLVILRATLCGFALGVRFYSLVSVLYEKITDSL